MYRYNVVYEIIKDGKIEEIRSREMKFDKKITNKEELLEIERRLGEDVEEGTIEISNFVFIGEEE